MKLVEVDHLEAQRLERGFNLLENACRGEVLSAVQEAVEVVAELGRDEPVRTVVAAEVIADQPLGEVIAVAFGGVDEVDADFGRLVEDGVRLGLGKGAAPLTTILPGAKADDRHPQARAAKNSITHRETLPQNRKSETRIILS